MKTNRPLLYPAFMLLLALVLAPAPSALAAVMSDYSIVPPFVQQPPTPNLLMMFDNSASMYDLSYSDLGKKDANGTFTRQPYYCYDQTYSSANTYAGIFENAKFYAYNLTSEYFQETATFPSSCTKRVANQLCIDISGTSVTTFVASGNYLNWLAASKFDVQKKVLTGGKYNTGTQNIEAESRGCVGNSYVKEANTANFVNYNAPESNNPNTSLGITFGVRGPYDAVNRSAPSPGGQTYIDIYQGNYNQADCQDAIVSITTGGNADIKQDVDACLTSLSGTTTTTTKTQVSFQQGMQACWQLREGHDIGGDDINTVKNQCTDIYDEYATCSNNPQQVCTTSTDCGAGNTCNYGPGAIVPGNPALLCGSEYEGQYYYYQGATTAGACTYDGAPCTTSTDCSPATYKQCSKTSNVCTSDADCLGAGNKCNKTIANTCTTGSVAAGWKLIPGVTEEQMIATHTQFCSDVTATPVTDPTDAPSDTSLYENVPAILSGVGLAAQLNQPIRTLSVKLHTTVSPTGLIHEFRNSIRFGAMQFNFNGSESECSATSAVKCPKVCSNNSSRSCTTNIDCVSPGTCVDASGNQDGARIFHYVGAGKCSSTTSTVCSTDSHCPSGETCVSDGVGTHASGLIAGIDAMRGSTWTPFAEGFYNAIGYFARTSSGSSRTDLRLNTSDFNADLNPLQSDCQKNFVLIVSDGTSTTDQNSSVSSLAALYAGQSGNDTGTCSNYAGSQNLDNFAWLARNRNIQSFSTSTASTTAPTRESEYVSTYVVYNGTSNGQSGDCESETIMSKAASKGGGQYYQPTGDPSDPNNGLYTKMRAAFESIASVGSSATAASILSNSDNNGSNLLQALFYPSKYFGATKISWIGEVHGLWFYIDPYLTNSTIREDTDSDKKLKLKNDYVVHLAYSDTRSQTEVTFQQDADGNGSGDTALNPSGRLSTSPPPYLPDDMRSLWRGGKSLLSMNPAERTDANPNGRKIKVSFYGMSTPYQAYSSYLQPFLSGDYRVTHMTPYLDMGSRTVSADVDAAVALVNYVRGTDASGYRNRTVTYDGVTGVWKLGDIIASTPKIQSGVKLQNYDVSVYGGGYGDTSYYDFTSTTAYKQRGMAYVGANDGMLHAFSIGSFGKGAANTDEVSVITGSNIGREEWAFIPMQALPYLKYLRDPDYTHLYYMDTSPTLLDASIEKSSTVTGCISSVPYWDCSKDVNSWRTLLLGGMGLGGASRIKGDSCTNCVKTPITDPDNASKGVGYSSYFALDITTPATPTLLWEFAHPQLGFATSGPAIVRVGDPTKNGRWFAVFASGPTGPIDTDTHQFLGRSDQNLRLFILDLKTGTLVKTIDTGIANAFGASMLGSTMDTDKFDGRNGVYTDDMLYVGYVREGRTLLGTGTGVWDKGGVIRLATRDLLNTSANSYSPDNPGWAVNKVIDGIGPVTSGIGKIIDRQTGKLWLYFGTGRFFYRTISSSDLGTDSDQMALYGITDPCFMNNDLADACVTDSSNPTLLDPATDLVDQTSTISASLGSAKGWFINLDQRDDTTGYFAERVITDPVAAANGIIYFTSFKPSQDTCSFSGNTYLWAVKYDTGGAIPTHLRSGKIVLQVSTGAFQEVEINSAFTQRGDRATTGLGGIPSGAGTAPSVISNAGMTPVRKILHVRER